ncbi:hypothetical protein HMPREF6745_0208 [Prevotella sp. oral taxon 472 str. F0295]|nr:hypothetical protein HMPREF6745_0208 [Prevotella sp. oral taxon 472 str. F0295]
MPWYIYFGKLFHVMWNVVPCHLEHGSTSHGTGFDPSDSVAVNQKAQYKGLSMAFRKQMFKGMNNGFVCCVLVYWCTNATPLWAKLRHKTRALAQSP